MANENVISVSDESPAEVNRVQAKIKRNRGTLGSGFAFVLCGYPGAGKTTAAEEIEKHISSKTDQKVAKVNIDSLLDGDEEIRSDEASLLKAINDKYDLAGAGVAVVDAAHSMDEIVELSQFFDRVGIIFIEANSLARHNRLIEQEKEKPDSDMEAVSKEQLKMKDSKHDAIGTLELREYEFYDTEIENVAMEKSEFEKFARYAGQDLWNDYLYR